MDRPAEWAPALLLTLALACAPTPAHCPFCTAVVDTRTTGGGVQVRHPQHEWCPLAGWEMPLDDWQRGASQDAPKLMFLGVGLAAGLICGLAWSDRLLGCVKRVLEAA